MTFSQKSAIATILALVSAYGGYGVVIAANVETDSLIDVGYKPMMVAATVVLALVMALSHAVLAMTAPRSASDFDERDRSIASRAAAVSGHVLAVGVFVALVLVLVESSSFVVANALLLAWVIAEVTCQATTLVLYRRAG